MLQEHNLTKIHKKITQKAGNLLYTEHKFVEKILNDIILRAPEIF